MSRGRRGATAAVLSGRGDLVAVELEEIVGRGDQAPLAEHVLATCPTADASWYDGVGHAPHMEAAERFNRELAELTRRAL